MFSFEYRHDRDGPAAFGISGRSEINVSPLLLMVPATLSASCAFMLPVATPPNAIVFGSGEVSMSDMMRVGIIMNLVGVVLITSSIYLLGLVVFKINAPM